MYWVTLPLKRYAQFSGRSRRKEFWTFFLFQFVVGVVLSILDAIVSPGSQDIYADPSVPSTISGLMSLVLFIPNLAVTARRLHDTDRSAWWLGAWFLAWLVLIIIVVSALLSRGEGNDVAGWAVSLIISALTLGILSVVLIVFNCLDGTRGPNRYGSDPKGRDVHETFA